MSALETLIQHAIATPDLKALLKSTEDDECFIDILVREGQALGYDVNATSVRRRMDADRKSVSQMDPVEFENVAGTMLGARLSGGHQSGSDC